MRSRMLLVMSATAALTIGLLPSVAPLRMPVSDDPTPYPASSSSLPAIPLPLPVVVVPLDFDSIPAKPFARFALAGMYRNGMRNFDNRAKLRYSEALTLSDDLSEFSADNGQYRWRWDTRTGQMTSDYESENEDVRRWRVGAHAHLTATHTTIRGDAHPLDPTATRTRARLHTERHPGGVELAADVPDRDVIVMGVSPDGKLVYVADGKEVRAWSVDPIQAVKSLAAIGTKDGFDPQRFRVLPSPSGRFVAVVADQGFDEPWRPQPLKCWDPGPPPPYLSQRRHPVRIQLFDTTDWRVTSDYQEEAGRHYNWVPDGRFASRSMAAAYGCYGGDDHVGSDRIPFDTVYRDPATNRTTRHGRTPQAERPLASVAVILDGRALVGWKGYECTLFDLESDKPPRVLTTPARIDRMGTTRDGRFLVALHCDDTVSLYDLCGVTRPPADYTAGRCWEELTSDFLPTFHRAVRWAVEHPAEAIPALRREAEGRAVVPAERVSGWVADLSSRQFTLRQAATRELGEHLAEVRPALEKAVSAPDTPEAEARLTDLLAKPDPVTPETRHSRWAVFVLEQIGTPEAKAVLRRWAEGAFPFGLPAEAKAARKRLGDR